MTSEFSVVAVPLKKKGDQQGDAVLQGAQAGVNLAVSMGGAICLWSGLGKLMEKLGITDTLPKLLSPLLRREVLKNYEIPEEEG